VQARPLTRPIPISLLPGGYPRDLDGNRFTTLASAHLREAALRTLVTASGERRFAFPDGPVDLAVARALAPEVLHAQDRLFSKPTIIANLTDDHRFSGVEGRVAVRLRPTNPRPVDGPEYVKTKRSQAGGASSGEVKSHQWEVSGSVTAVGGLTAPLQPGAGGAFAGPGGVFVAQLNPFRRRWGQSRKQELAARSRLRLTGRPERAVLVQLDVDAEVIAETRRHGRVDRWDLVSDGSVKRAGEHLMLPNAVQMWMTEAQLHELRTRDLEYHAVEQETQRAVLHQQQESSLQERHDAAYAALAATQLWQQRALAARQMQERLDWAELPRTDDWRRLAVARAGRHLRERQLQARAHAGQVAAQQVRRREERAGLRVAHTSEREAGAAAKRAEVELL